VAAGIRVGRANSIYMKVLLLSHQLDFSGAPLALRQMARVLRLDGHEVSLLSLKDGPLRESFTQLGVHCGSINEAIQRPDLVVANTVLTVPLSHRLRAKGIRTFNWIHEATWFLNALRIDRVAAGFDQVTEIIVPSQFMVEELSSTFPNALFAVLPNLVDVPQPSKLNRGHWFVVPGNWETRKGQAKLLQIMQGQGLDLPVKFLGAAARDLSFPKVYTFTGQVDHERALEHIASAKMVVSPAVSETQNLTVLEAIGKHTPILLSDIPAHRELASYFEGIPLFNTENAESLQRGILHAIKESTDTNLLNKRFKLLQKRFGRESYQQKIREIFHKCDRTTSQNISDDKERNEFVGSESDNCSLSVITVVLKPDERLLKSYNSIVPLLDKFSRIEWVIKSAVQSDLRLFGIQPHRGIRLEMSEDGGIYEAMNQASRVSKGRYLMFVGSGDLLLEHGMSCFMRLVDQHPKLPDVIFFSSFMESWGRVWHPMPEDMPKRMSTPHAGVIVKRDLFERLGGYLESYEIAGDYDFISRCLKADNLSVFWKSAQPLAHCEGNGVSVVRFLEAFLEETLIRVRVWGVPYEQVSVDLQRYLRGPFLAISHNHQKKAAEA
jgi:glycosyltransferase involved in cell wall biosynthesis